MQLAILRAELQANKPAVGAPPANWEFLAGAPVLPTPAAPNAPFGLVQPALAVLPSVLGLDAYEAHNVSSLQFYWDAATVGYGLLQHIIHLAPGNMAAAREIASYSATRAQMLNKAYTFPYALPGPAPRWHYHLIERSERTVISFLLGQAIAMRAARISWGVPRLFHRSLYGPLLPALCPGAVPLPPDQSPDFACFVPNPQVNGQMMICLIEAKGTHSRMNLNTNAEDRELFNKAFRDQIRPTHNAIPGGAYRCAVSIACQDKSMPDRIVAQFWDPTNPDSQPVNKGALHLLTAQYFLALHGVLQCLPQAPELAGPERVSWHSRILGLRIEMHAWQWDAMERLAQRRLTEPQFYDTVAELDRTYDPADEHGHNGDGLYLRNADEFDPEER